MEPDQDNMNEWHCMVFDVSNPSEELSTVTGTYDSVLDWLKDMSNPTDVQLRIVIEQIR